MADAASHLSDKEFLALRLRVTAGYSRGEAAQIIFGDGQMKKRVDGLVERGARKLAKAWSNRRPSRGPAGRSILTGRSDDKEGTDE